MAEEDFEEFENKASDEESEELENIVEESQFIPDLRNQSFSISLEPREVQSLERSIRFIDREENEEQNQAGIYDLKRTRENARTNENYSSSGDYESSKSYEMPESGFDMASRTSMDFRDDNLMRNDRSFRTDVQKNVEGFDQQRSYEADTGRGTRDRRRL